MRINVSRAFLLLIAAIVFSPALVFAQSSPPSMTLYINRSTNYTYIYSADIVPAGTDQSSIPTLSMPYYDASALSWSTSGVVAGSCKVYAWWGHFTSARDGGGTNTWDGDNQPSWLYQFGPFTQSGIFTLACVSAGDGYIWQTSVIADVGPPPVPTCSVTADTNPLGYGNSTTLRWNSTGAYTSFYISNVGYVTANQSGSASVGPLASTGYNGTAVGPGGSTSCPFSLTVNAPASCAFNGSTVAHGASATAYQSSTVPYGSSCVSQTRTCGNGTLSGSYAYSSCAVGPQCTLSLNPSSITRGQSSTLSWSSSNATSCTGGNFSAGNNVSGSTSVSPAQTTTYTGSCTGAGGTAQCNGGTGATLTVSCTPETSYSCFGTNVVQTSTSSQCAVTTTNPYVTCTAPNFCASGSAVCINPSPAFNASGSLSGHFLARPSLVKKGETVRLYWNVSNVLSCAVSGNNDTKNSLTGGASGTTTLPINSQAIYVLTCLKLPDGSSSVSEQQTINIVPEFNEQ